MTNPTTIDRRDVAHPTNPVGGQTHIEQQELGQPLDAGADRLPASGQGAAIRGVPGSASRGDAGDERYGVPPARSGQASAERAPAEIRGRTSNSGGANRIDPDSRIPQPVKQDLGFRRTSGQGER